MPLTVAAPANWQRPWMQDAWHSTPGWSACASKCRLLFSGLRWLFWCLRRRIPSPKMPTWHSLLPGVASMNRKMVLSGLLVIGALGAGGFGIYRLGLERGMATVSGDSAQHRSEER